MSLSIANRKEFFIWMKKDVYNLMVIHGNLLQNKNIKVNKKIELLLVATQ